jgi:iron complex outermembrane recepter protein
MTKRARLTVLTLLGGAGSLCWQASSALDATAPNDDSTTLETVIVTAEKRAEPLQDVPMSVTALSGGELDRLQDRSFADYASLVPGLSLQTAQPGNTRLTLRGQNAGGVGSTVAVYIDESPFGSSNALANGAFNTGDFDTWDMQRIEVLRGPQGTLYGANSEGGLLKFVTNAPMLGSLSGAAEVTGESVDHGGKGGDVHAMLNLPLGDMVAFRISGFDQDVPGYVSDPLSGERDVNDGHEEGGRASLLVAPTDALSIRLTALSQQAKYNGTNLVDINPVTLQPLYGNLTQERFLQEPSSFKYENYNATITWSPGPLSVLSNTSYGIVDADTDTDATPVYGGIGGELFGLAPTAAGALLDDNVSTKKFTQEVRLTSPSSSALEWQVGGYYTRETSVLNEILNAVELPAGTQLGLIEQPLLDSVYKETAGFGDLTYHFNSQFDIQIGGRYSHNEQTFAQTTTFNSLISPTPQYTTGSSNGNVVTYSVAPSWHVDADTMVYARVATGYRPGGPNDLPPPQFTPGVPRTYGSDKTTNVELGIRSTQLNGVVSIDVAAYHVNWKDIQLLEVVGGFGINANGGTARTQGLEWTFGYVPVRGLKLQWIGAFTEANLTSPATALNANSGAPLPYAPKWTTALDGQYEWTAFADYKGFIGATWSYVGSRSSDFSSIADAPPVVLPSYNTTAVRLGLENDRYRVMLYGKNLSDARGITDYTSAPGGSPYSTISVIQPRTVGLALSAKF